MEHEITSTLAYSQQLTTCPYPRPGQSIPRRHIIS